jgi:hypothetical protein
LQGCRNDLRLTLRNCRRMKRRDKRIPILREANK